MNQHLEKISDFIQQHELLSAEDKTSLLQLLKNTNKELEIIAFKLDRTEKVKRTTAILLEETIQELEQKRKAVEESNLALEKSLVELKAAQQQLIQSEKMASLGELTAGIAHEIQNPLNFVNNFSEVSKELLDEMKSALDEGNENAAKALANDIIQNLEKIYSHGKRADAIVKGMLQHSRASGSQKIPTHINALADEYLRLAFHGLRAKDKTFNATLETRYDEAIGPVNMIPQDIGRVLLNLLTNAFYAVSEKNKLYQSSYQPTVWLTTQDYGDMVSIIVKDNGNGIPANIIEKIFQPFFTTKPSGQGTGLGLSLAYDIIQAHHGELNVTTKEGEYTAFTIRLPHNSKL
jgi:two-component system NtrC family sensor kinase